jgi:hypothetical protein
MIAKSGAAQNGKNISRNGQEEGHTEAQSSQRKAKLFILLNRDLKLFLAFFVYGRAFARAGYVFARDDFRF